MSNMSVVREASRILAMLVEHMHAEESGDRLVRIEANIPLAVFDRMCVWGAAIADAEDDDPAEDGGDLELEDYS